MQPRVPPHLFSVPFFPFFLFSFFSSFSFLRFFVSSSSFLRFPFFPFFLFLPFLFFMMGHVFIELTDERGRTARADVHKNGLVRPRTKGSVVCWSLVVAPCWAYVARTRAVSLSSVCCLSGAWIRRERGALRIHAPDHDWSQRAARAAAHSGKAHARRAVMLLARRIDRLPPEVWMIIAGFLAAMCEEP
jgi:hypothetical protein